MHYKATTVMFADIAESVRLVAHNEQAIVERMRGLLAHCSAHIIPSYSGRLVERLGDGLVVEFSDPRAAALCALALHDFSHEKAQEAMTGPSIRFRIGIHTADVLTDEQSLFGMGVNLAARICAAARVGETLLSTAVQDHLVHGLDGQIRDCGLIHLKHIEHPLRLYAFAPLVELFTPELSLEAPMDIRTTIAVIPLKLLSGNTSQFWLGEAIVDSVIAALSRIPELRVISRLSTTHFQDRSASPAAISAHLGAVYVVSGSCHATDTEARLHLELCDTRSNEVMLVQRRTIKIDAVFSTEAGLGLSLADEMVRNIVQTEARLGRNAPLPNLDAYSLYLGGISLIHRTQFPAFKRAQELFQHLSERHPRHPLPHAWLGAWRVFKVTQGWYTNLAEEAQFAREHTQRALDLSPSNATALTVDGLVNTNLLHLHQVAQSRFQQAIAENPNEPLAWIHQATMHAFQNQGPEALACAERANALSPLDPWRYYYDSLSSTAALAAEDYEAAVKYARSSLRANCMHLSTLRALAIASAQLGRDADAQEAARQLLQHDPEFSVRKWHERTPSKGFPTAERWAAALLRAGLPE